MITTFWIHLCKSWNFVNIQRQLFKFVSKLQFTTHIASNRRNSCIFFPHFLFSNFFLYHLFFASKQRVKHLNTRAKKLLDPWKRLEDIQIDMWSAKKETYTSKLCHAGAVLLSTAMFSISQHRQLQPNHASRSQVLTRQDRRKDTKHALPGADLRRQ